jgi:hypothetical protein
MYLFLYFINRVASSFSENVFRRKINLKLIIFNHKIDFFISN